jgi:hypothetical protein
MTQEHDYKWALSLGAPFPQRTEQPITEAEFKKYREIVENALKLADKVTGKPNSSMVKAGESESLRLYYDTMRNDNLHTRAACAFNVFKAMIAQAQKEIE